MAMPLLSQHWDWHQLTRLLPLELVAIVWLFPSDQVTVPFPLPLLWHWAFPQPGPCSAIPRFRAGATEPCVGLNWDLAPEKGG